MRIPGLQSLRVQSASTGMSRESMLESLLRSEETLLEIHQHATSIISLTDALSSISAIRTFIGEHGIDDSVVKLFAPTMESLSIDLTKLDKDVVGEKLTESSESLLEAILHTLAAIFRKFVDFFMGRKETNEKRDSEFEAAAVKLNKAQEDDFKKRHAALDEQKKKFDDTRAKTDEAQRKLREKLK